jgi:hypothetical protein
MIPVWIHSETGDHFDRTIEDDHLLPFDYGAAYDLDEHSHAGLLAGWML